MRPHRVQQSQITTPTGSIRSGGSHDISIVLAILLLKKIEAEYIILRVIFHPSNTFKRKPPRRGQPLYCI